jgi:hypothetical protein
VEKEEEEKKKNLLMIVSYHSDIKSIRGRFNTVLHIISLDWVIQRNICMYVTNIINGK